MYLDYSKLEFDQNGMPEHPVLVLKTMHGDTIGPITGAYNLKMSIKFSEPSEMEFDVPAMIDGRRNWIYDEVSGYKIVYTDKYGIYVIMNPATNADGISEIKHVKCYSIEKALDTKKLFLEDGDGGSTFKFCNLTNPQDPDTIMGRVLEVADGWQVGYVSPAVAQRYRTFDGYDGYLMSFLYGDCKEKFRCVFVFDPYTKSINVYDADQTLDTIPIYLDFENLLETVDVDEITDDLVTAIRPYGSDDLDIRAVNPIGSNWLYDISYFISNGDVPKNLADKWTAWQQTILSQRQYYNGLTALRASASAAIVSEQAQLTDLNGELDTLRAQQNVTIQASALETTDAGKANRQAELDQINLKIEQKKTEIDAKEHAIEQLQNEQTTYGEKIQAVVNELAIDQYFSDEEYTILRNYIIEQELTESSFVATTVDAGTSGVQSDLGTQWIGINGASIVMIPFEDTFQKRMYQVTGGSISISADPALSADIVRGTLEVGKDGSSILSLYTGSTTVGANKYPSATMTMVGTIGSLTNDIHGVTVDGVTTQEGTDMRFQFRNGTLYITSNVSDYQKYSVQLELLDYATNVLADLSSPTYEFTVDSANFVFAQEFAPFRNQLQLGKGIYLNLGSGEVITPYIIEIELDFESHDQFSLIFSNRFKRKDYVNTLKDMVETSYSTSRNFDSSKYIYNQAARQAASVSRFMQSSLDAAVNTVIGAKNQSVIINGSGIHVGGDSKYQLRIVDSMIAMSDDNWATAKMAIGRFASDEIGEYFGVNAEVIGGKLIVGNNLVIENETDTGVMQFKVDSSGAWLNNSTFVLQSDGGGKIILDPKYGIAAGTANLYTVDGTTVSPAFIENGTITMDDDQMPKYSNFYLDIGTGNVYFRGKVNATSGKIGGFSIESDYLHAGSGGNYVALNGSGTNDHSAYAIWAGAEAPANAKFYVKKDGTLYAKDGTFGGTLNAVTLAGALKSKENDPNAWLIGCGIKVGGSDPENSPNFMVDQAGNVTMKGSINMSGGNITWGSSSSPVRVLYARSYLSRPTSSYNSYPSSSSSGWHRTLDSSNDYYASYSYDGGSTWGDAIRVQGKDGTNGRDGVDGVDGEDGSDASVTSRNVFNALTSNGTLFGVFSDSATNKLYINADYIKAGTIDARSVTLGDDDGGGFCVARGNDGTSTTFGAKIYGGDPNYYLIATGAGVRMQGGQNGESFYVSANAVYASCPISEGSDRRLKNSISSDLERYVPFYLNLKPSYYKFNNGTSGRYHAGFIAQEVEQALTDNGLTTQDFAGLVKDSDTVGNENKLPSEYSLRYTEFVSLNTYMIQRLYRRVEELERKLNEN